jgi:hypothetical protein
MKNAIIFILLNFFSSSLFSQPGTSLVDSAKPKEDAVYLFGRISNIKFATHGKNQAVSMILNQKNSSGFLSLILSSQVGKDYIEDLKSTYLNQYVVVKGKVELFNGNPQMAIKSRRQIALAKEDLRNLQFEPE